MSIKTVVFAVLIALSSIQAFAQQATAQQDAELMARRGVLAHCNRAGGRREGIGFSPTSADAAIKNCCFWGKYRVREIGVARGARGWYACVRYE